MTTGSRENHSDSGARTWFPGGCRCGRGVCWERGADAGRAQRCVLTRACRAQHADASAAAAGRGGALGAEGSTPARLREWAQLRLLVDRRRA